MEKQKLELGSSLLKNPCSWEIGLLVSAKSIHTPLHVALKFVKYQIALDLHVFPIPIPPPTMYGKNHYSFVK